MIDLGTGLDPSRAHLFGRLGIIEASVRATVDARRLLTSSLRYP